MGSIKISKFLGEAPKLSSELLPDGLAQTAINTKLYSGDLIPYREPKEIQDITNLDTSTAAPVKTLHRLVNPSNGANVFLTWKEDVDVAVAAPPWTVSTTTEDTEQRFYYTDGVRPKVSNYALATTGSVPYPVTNGYYDLGLPLPTAVPTASETTFSTLTTVSFARDSGNEATIITNSAHNLTPGNIVTIRDFDDDDEAKSFNLTNVEVSKTETATSFTYYSPGDQVSTTADTDGRVELAGNTQMRTYVYTWVTPWDEESIPSLPSEEIYLKEGQTVTITGLPTAKPSGQNFVRGIRLYRTVVSAAATEYFLLETLWFPTSLSKVSILPSGFILKPLLVFFFCT